ncbi:hypothetical protein JNB71_10920 [Rhizobium herbae]|uniref:RiboL-PSP-HEPN domain-containing protein n=1 Tax=Rhizobium herbae TaxID=508661 RepID=A0ABS7H9G0_9HYPH|nr:hypothetical protein [Rhizobium herbae]MBW9063833.1 hypothetical protein [Rhizobium herbae]
MVVKKHIEENLTHLDQAYRREPDVKKATYFSKLAILELCGWIELSMDGIILGHCARKVRLPANTRLIEDHVKRTYGFDYERHFRKMLINLVGVVACENVEASVNAAAKARLEAQLRTLKTVRDGLAHTYLQGPAPIVALDAPSATKARLGDIYYGLKEFQRALRQL